MTELQEDFEKWAKSVYCGYSFKFKNGSYIEDSIDDAWLGYQARAKREREEE